MVELVVVVVSVEVVVGVERWIKGADWRSRRY